MSHEQEPQINKLPKTMPEAFVESWKQNKVVYKSLAPLDSTSDTPNSIIQEDDQDVLDDSITNDPEDRSMIRELGWQEYLDGKSRPLEEVIKELFPEAVDLKEGIEEDL